MVRRLLYVGAAFILVAASVHGDLRAQSPPGEAPHSPADVVKLEGSRAFICGILTRELASASAGSVQSPFPHVILVRGKRFHLDPSPYKGLEGYLNELPAIRPRVYVEGKREGGEGFPAPGDGEMLIAVDFFQPLDHAREMGVVPSPTDEAKANAISKVGGLVATLPSDYPPFDAIVASLHQAGFEVKCRGKDGKAAACRKSGLIFAELSPGIKPDPAFLAALEIGRRVRVYPFKNTKEIDAVPPPTATAKAQQIKTAGGLAVTVPRGDAAVYDAIASGLRQAGFAVSGNPVHREAGNIFAEIQGKSPDLKYVAALAHDPHLRVTPFTNTEGHIPTGEQPGSGEPSPSTPPRQGQGSSVRPR